MARVDIPVQEAGFISEIDQLTFTSADAANDHSFENSGKEVLLVKNDDASSKTVTVVSVADPYGRTEDLSVVVPANSVGFVNLLLPSLFNQSDGTVHLDLTADTSLSFAAVRVDTRKK